MTIASARFRDPPRIPLHGPNRYGPNRYGPNRYGPNRYGPNRCGPNRGRNAVAFSFLLSLWLTTLCGPPANAQSRNPERDASAVEIEYFEKEIRPILAASCYECHSAKTADGPNGGLRLDRQSGWQQGGDGGPAIVPGEPAKSLLIEAIRYESLEMPPDGRLPEATIAKLTEWIKRGASAPVDESEASSPNQTIDWSLAKQFWAFQAPRRHQSLHHSAWCQNQVDGFVEDQLIANQLQAAPETTRRLWLRRVTLDLTGLAPTPAEWQRFTGDRHPLAYERVVDRLLASPRFGEQWGRHWLDVARYADSNGSDFNATFFSAWRYRNYVVQSFNQDLPYDQFVREQIAGDLLPAKNDRQRHNQLVASTFLMLAPKMLSERDKPRLLLDVADEQIDTVGRVFQGLTLGCARCHDHKFDPIATEDYYALLGIFHSTESLHGESQQYVSTWRETELPTSAAHRQRVADYDGKKKELRKSIASIENQIKTGPGDAVRLLELSRGVVIDDLAAKKTGKWASSTLTKGFVGQGYLHDEKKDKGEKSVRFEARVPKSGVYEVRLAYNGGSTRADAAPVTIEHAGGTTNWTWDQRKEPPIAGLFASAGHYTFDEQQPAVVTIHTRGSIGYVIVDAVQFIAEKQKTSDAIADANATESSKATAVIQKKQQQNQLAQLEAQKKALESQLKNLEADRPDPIPKAMAPREAEQIADQAVRIRGVHNRPGENIERGFIQVLSSDVAQSGRENVTQRNSSGRRELADWIASNSNPLTARVLVNRLWMKMLGEGLVRSVDNFGHLGDRPSHPALLDTLTVEFTENGWQIKPILRQIALSSTYRQSSVRTERGMSVDADNRWIWRQNRKALSAEQFRDSLLALAGDLDFRQPDSPVTGLGTLAINNSNQADSGVSTQAAVRSLYLPVVRNDLSPFMVTFDFADPDMVVGKRPSTNVPAQALMLLNSPIIRQAAEKLAKRTWIANAPDQSVEALFRVTYGRSATAEERARIEQFVGPPSQWTATDWADVAHSIIASTEFRWID
jgi:hypothetical protein